MPISSRVGLTHPESWHKVSEQGYLGLFFYRVRKKGSFEVLLVFFSTFSSQNLKYPTLMHWLASWVNPTSKTHIPCLPTTSQVPPVKFSLDSVALNFRPIWCHRPSLKHCVREDILVICTFQPQFQDMYFPFPLLKYWL